MAVNVRFTPHPAGFPLEGSYKGGTAAVRCVVSWSGPPPAVGVVWVVG